MAETPNHHIVILTGELSGEIHGAHLVASIKAKFPSVTFSAMGSRRMAEAGARIIMDYKEISIMGISEVFSRLHHIRRAFSTIKAYLIRTMPSLVVLVDFPGFNLRMAAFARKLGIPVVYFIPPQVWAWKKGRIHKIKKYVDLVISILPFEKKLYDEYGIDNIYIGHPFMDTVKPSVTREEFLDKIGSDGKTPVITIMPGSRENEIRKHIEIMLQVVERMRTSLARAVVVLPLAESIDETVLEPFAKRLGEVRIIRGGAYNALAYCDIAIASSGSATLEAAILGAPTIVIYRISAASYFIARLIVHVDFISLPNIIAEKEVFPEFIQSLDPEKIAEKALLMVQNGKEVVARELHPVIEKLGSHNSYDHARDAIVTLLENRYGPIPETLTIS